MQTLRSLLRTPGFTVAVVLTLALGIGADTAIFSVVDGALLRPAPFADLGRLVMVWETDRNSNTTREPASIPDYFDFQERATRFERLAAFSPITVTITPDNGEPDRLPGLWVSHEFLPMLGIQPRLGVTFSADEDLPGARPVVMVSEAFWTERLARDPEVIGKSLRIQDEPYTIVAVLPASADFGTLQILRHAAYRRGFADQGERVRVDLWLPLRPNRDADRGNHPIFVMGRLGGGATLASAQQEMTRIATDLEREYREANDGRGVNLESLDTVVFGGAKPALLILLGAVALVLLVACANVANLLLARGVARAREVAVRSALGAGLARLTRQYLLESALLTGMGALAGIVLAYGGHKLLLAWAPASVPRVNEIAIDTRVLGVTLGVSIVVAIIFGVLPAAQAIRGGFAGLASGNPGRGASAGRSHSRFRSALVVTQLTLAIMLLAGAGLLIRSFWKLSQVDAGFETRQVIKADFQLPRSYPQRMRDFPQWTEIRRFAATVRERVGALPGVEAVSIVGSHPLEAGFTSSIVVMGREAEAGNWPEPSIRFMDGSYLAVTRGRVIEGRGLTDADDVEAPPVVLINQAARTRFFAHREALGAQIGLWGRARTVVGVLADERIHGLASPATPAVYLPTGQGPVPSGSILVRVAGDAKGFGPTLRRTVREIEPALALTALEPLTETMAKSNAERRFTMILLGIFAAVSLLLAVIGVHGLLSYTVAQRTRELGIRMALGADGARVRSLVLGQGARLALGGILLGVAGALATTRVLRSLLYGTSPGDPIALGVAILVLAGVTLLASWLPARRAAGTDPAVVLRSE
jgi:putative ABC transport system permease protein